MICFNRDKMDKFEDDLDGRCDFLAIDLYPWIENPSIFKKGFYSHSLKGDFKKKKT
jgi:hypothetical protein